VNDILWIDTPYSRCWKGGCISIGDEECVASRDRKITATYDALGRQLTLNDPDKGNWAYVNSALGSANSSNRDVSETTSWRIAMMCMIGQ